VRVFFSLNVVVARFQSLTSFGAGIDRLFGFAEVLDHVEPETTEATETADKPTILVETADYIAFKDFTLQTPNYKRMLVEDLSLQLPEQKGLLIMGPSGCGKSSLLRAIAGLWNSGSGIIQRPELDHMLFLPQKPYMILGTLRDQMLYPKTDREVDDATLKQALKAVNLADLDERFGGFDAEEDWGDVLSLGEQQRLTFARILLNQPDFAILDEATSALDMDNESRLYDQLKHTGTTFISVGHRESLNAFHQNVLELTEDHTWNLHALEPAGDSA
jgi:putative ATP-binding cassette transporter